MKLVKKAGCDEWNIYRSHPFLVKDVLFNAILVAANEALLEIAGLVEAQDGDHMLIADWITRGHRGSTVAEIPNSAFVSITICGPEGCCGRAPWPASPP